jgi:hypothetical protein
MPRPIRVGTSVSTLHINLVLRSPVYPLSPNLLNVIRVGQKFCDHVASPKLYAYQPTYTYIIMILRKDQLEASLHEEKKLIETGRLKEDSPLDFSTTFEKLCEACRKGDLKACQEMITEGANINARDQFDYTPLILVGGAPLPPPTTEN